MDRKHSRNTSLRACRKRKRYFTGNQHTSENSEYTSTSAEKLKKNDSFDVNVDPSLTYCIIQFTLVFSALQNLLKCKECNGDVRFFKRDERGLGFKLSVKCSCKESFIDSCPKIASAYEINRRFVLAMRLVGVGFSGAINFCGLMDLGVNFSIRTYYRCADNIKIATDAVLKIVLNKAAAEEKEKNKEAGNVENELSVSGDGSWAKRGFTSLLGIVSLIGKYSNKVLDVIVKSSTCKACAKWKGKEDTVEYEAFQDEHEQECTANHTGSAGKMEVDGVLEMFERSEDLHDAKYRYYIGDGDTKTFKALLAAQPYGEDFTVKKKECVLHVKKRMYRRAKEAKKLLTQTRRQKIKDEKEAQVQPTGKKSTKSSQSKKIQLTNKLMKDLSLYYGLAIRRHADSLENTRKEIWAAYYHKISTDEKPQHSYCPSGADSWCTWRKCEAAGSLESYEHPPPLDDDVQEILKPIYEDLTTDELLERCLGNNTQNNNECFNSCVWHLATKHIFAGRKIIEIATYISACVFNDGFQTVLKIMEVMGITIGPAAIELARKHDKARVAQANRLSTDNSVEARIARRNKKAAQEEAYEEAEGILYAAGIAD